MKKLVKMMLCFLVLAVALATWWSSLSDSKRRFFVHLGKQLPAMPFRYFA